MSKKNNKDTRRRLHAAELEKEKVEREKRERAQQKKQELKAASGGVQKTKVNKPFRIRKGVHLKGIKVTDSDSKKKVRRLLKAEAAMKMDVDDGKTQAVMKRKTSLKGIRGIKLKSKKDNKKPAKAAKTTGDSMVQ